MLPAAWEAALRRGATTLPWPWLAQRCGDAYALASFPFDWLAYRAARFRRAPYFGTLYAARQGTPARHRRLRALVRETCRAGEPLRILEIGSWAGESALVWASALRDCHGSEGSVVCLDAWRPFAAGGAASIHYRRMQRALAHGTIRDLFAYNRRMSGLAELILPCAGRAEQVLPVLPRARFDIVYVDADHRYHAVRRDLALALPLLREGGILCGDDLELQLPECDADHVRASAECDYVRDPRSGRYHHPGVTLAVWECAGSVWSADGVWAVRRCGDGVAAYRPAAGGGTAA